MAMLAIVALVAFGRGCGDYSWAGNPPTLAVISWQWLTQGDADQQTKGALASLLLMLLLRRLRFAELSAMAQLAAHYSRVDGIRKPADTFITGHYAGEFLPLTGVLCVVLLAILADQSTINSEALINSLTMGLVATFIALLLLLLWLEWGTASPVVALVAHLYCPLCHWWRASTRWR